MQSHRKPITYHHNPNHPITTEEHFFEFTPLPSLTLLTQEPQVQWIKSFFSPLHPYLNPLGWGEGSITSLRSTQTSAFGRNETQIKSTVFQRHLPWGGGFTKIFLSPRLVDRVQSASGHSTPRVFSTKLELQRQPNQPSAAASKLFSCSCCWTAGPVG